MAIRRGEAEKVLRLSIEVEKDEILDVFKKDLITSVETTEEVSLWLEKAISDSYRRLIGPSIETEIRLHLKNRAEEEAIKVFSKNLENLLLLPPMPRKVVMGVDPGIRTGSKLAIVSPTGKFLKHEIIYPQFDDLKHPKSVRARTLLIQLIGQYQVQVLAIGNGTGSREIDRFFLSQVIRENHLQVKRVTVVMKQGQVFIQQMKLQEKSSLILIQLFVALYQLQGVCKIHLQNLLRLNRVQLVSASTNMIAMLLSLILVLQIELKSCVNRVGVHIKYSILQTFKLCFWSFTWNSKKDC